jgi:adenylate cyclase class 2
MPLEIERKYRFSDFAVLRTRLREARAEYRGRDFEENVVLDTPERDLRKGEMLLRLRIVGQSSVLCLKKPPQESSLADRYKVYDEIETTVDDSERMQEIFRHLGYELAFRYEKLRETWRLDGVTVCLDHLPIGRYVELEGDEESIPGAVEILGLQGCPSTNMNYHQLNKSYRREHGLEDDDSFVFSPREKQRLIERLGK